MISLPTNVMFCSISFSLKTCINILMKFILLAMIVALSVCVPTTFYKAFNTADFNDLDGWTAIGAQSGTNYFYNCGSTRLVGGFKIFAKGASLVKTVKLVPHYRLVLRAQFWKIDSWDGESFFVYVDQNLVFKKEYQYTQGVKVCGSNNADWKTLTENIEIALDHTSPTATIVFTSSLDQNGDDESWGIRDVEILLERCPVECEACNNGNAKECAQWKAAVWTWTDETNLGADKWSVDKADAKGTTCGGVAVFGGSGVFGAGAAVNRKFDLPPHYRIKVKLVFMKIDSWDNEKASLLVDNTEVWTQNFQYNQGYWNQLCGAGGDWREMVQSVETEVQHTGPALVRITSNLNEAADNESWGVRDFFIYVAKCADNCAACSGPQASDCQKCAGDYKLQEGQCKLLTSFILLNAAFQDKKFFGVDGWTIKGNANSLTQSTCGDATLIGGFNVFGAGAWASKKFDVPLHSRLRVQVQFYKIDSWDNEFLYVDIDGRRVWQQQIGFASGGEPLCGRAESNWNELIIDVDLVVDHRGDTAEIKFSSSLDQGAEDGTVSTLNTVESWGFRKFRLLFEPRQECAIFYTECGFKGYSYEFCQASPDFRKESIPSNFQSVRVPPNSQVTLYSNSEYVGRYVIYTESQECIQKIELQWKTLPADGSAPTDGVAPPTTAPATTAGGAGDARTVDMDGLPAQKSGPPGSPGYRGKFIQLRSTIDHEEELRLDEYENTLVNQQRFLN